MYIINEYCKHLMVWMVDYSFRCYWIIFQIVCRSISQTLNRHGPLHWNNQTASGHFGNWHVDVRRQRFGLTAILRYYYIINKIFFQCKVGFISILFKYCSTLTSIVDISSIYFSILLKNKWYSFNDHTP